MSERLICTFTAIDAPRKCNAFGVEYCTDCLKEGLPGLADDCRVEHGVDTRDHPECPDCLCNANTHQEGFVACGPLHLASQLQDASAQA